MAYRYVVTGDAERDLEDIEAYVASYNDDESAVSDLVNRFISLFHDICAFPFFHAVYRFPADCMPKHTYRSANVGAYKVFYRIDEERGLVIIYRIRHQASDFTRIAW